MSSNDALCNPQGLARVSELVTRRLGAGGGGETKKQITAKCCLIDSVNRLMEPTASKKLRLC